MTLSKCMGMSIEGFEDEFLKKGMFHPHVLIPILFWTEPLL